jgi:hypothetical protein
VWVVWVLWVVWVADVWLLAVYGHGDLGPACAADTHCACWTQIQSPMSTHPQVKITNLKGMCACLACVHAGL